jgi:hypothetical protein
MQGRNARKRESIPDRRSAGAQEPLTVDSEVPQPDGADPGDLDAALTGMSTLLRVALRLMKSSGTGVR